MASGIIGRSWGTTQLLMPAQRDLITRSRTCHGDTSVDDTLPYDSSIEEAFWHIFEFLETCARAGVMLKPEKFKFCRREVKFVGFHLGWSCYQPSSECLRSIKDFAMPKQPSITDKIVVRPGQPAGSFLSNRNCDGAPQRAPQEASYQAGMTSYAIDSFRHRTPSASWPGRGWCIMTK